MSSIILRNESFGGVYFDQANGRTMMVDHEGFLTLMKYLEKKPLSEKEKRFSKIFFNNHSSSQIKLKLDPSIEFENTSRIITKTPILVDLSLNNYCNLKCPYCYMSAKPINEGENLSMDNFELILKDMRKSRVLQIALGGGEPTLHPSFCEILRKLRIEGDIIPNYTTNGTHLTHEILKASKKYCGAVAVSYSEERGQETIEATKKLLEYGIQTNLHVVLLKSRIPKLSEIVEKYAKLGISTVVLLLFKPMGRGVNLDHEIMNISEKEVYSQEIFKILALRESYGIKLALDACSAFTAKDFPFLPESLDGCTGGTYSTYIDWDLHMKPCSFMQNDRGIDLKKSSILNAWNSNFFSKFRDIILNPRYQGCTTCESFSSCWGGCPLKPELTYCKERGVEI